VENRMPLSIPISEMLLKKTMVFFHVALLSFVLPVLPVSAQQSMVDEVRLDAPDTRLLSGLQKQFNKTKGQAKDTVSVTMMLSDCLRFLHEEGYLEARIDSQFSDSGKRVVLFHKGPAYKWIALETLAEDDYILGAAGVRERLFSNIAFTPSGYSALTSRILGWCAANGYPFATVRLDSVRIIDSGIRAGLLVDEGDPVFLDTALIKGDARIAPAYLYNYLGIKPGSPFSQQVMSRVSVKLRELPFLTETRPVETEFFPGKARPVLFLKGKKASQFNGVVGIQPDNDRQGKVFVTGDIRMRLLNAFGKAELIDLNWSNPQPRSQELKLNFSYPFIFSLPIGVEGDLRLFKKDTVFLELIRQATFRYFFSGINSVRVFSGRKTSNLISTKGYENTTVLPPFADVASSNFGLGLQLQRLDYRLNPRRGYSLDVSAAAGVRTVSRNSRVNPAVYDSVKLRSTQYRAEGGLDVYFPVFSRGVVNAGVSGGWMLADNIFSNELYRFGGLKSLRGFDEQSLTASAYMIGKMEYRFILEQNSYLLLFYNRAWYEDRSRQEVLRDSPRGFGAGITFDTRLGVFSFTYAIGASQGTPLQFRSAKVHFGMINFF